MFETQWSEFSASACFSAKPIAKKEGDVWALVRTTWCHLLFLWCNKSALSCGGSLHVTRLAQTSSYRHCRLNNKADHTTQMCKTDKLGQHLWGLENRLFARIHTWREHHEKRILISNLSTLCKSFQWFSSGGVSGPTLLFIIIKAQPKFTPQEYKHKPTFYHVK